MSKVTAFITKFKAISHGIAVFMVALIAWAYSPQGSGVISAVIHAYPKASIITTVLAALSLIYHNPIGGNSATTSGSSS